MLAVAIALALCCAAPAALATSGVTPVDCEVSAWGAWTDCSTTCGGGLRSHTRTYTVFAVNGGSCAHSLVESEMCSVGPCPVGWMVAPTNRSCSSVCGGRTACTDSSMFAVNTADKFNFVNNFLSNPSTCTKVSPLTTFNHAPSFLGANCYITSATSGPICTTIFAKGMRFCCCGTGGCPLTNDVVDCAASEWSEWSASTCTATCGTGLATRTRTITTAAAFGGTTCGALYETMPCNTTPCPIDCQITQWSEWATCSATCEGTQGRSRTINADALHGATACPTELSETQSCGGSCPVDCEVSEWTEWAACSATCAGTQDRTRTIDVEAAFGGEACPSELSQVQTCSSPCPIDCEFNEWETDDVCSVTCGTGSVTYTRTVKTAADYGGVACTAELTKTESCAPGDCPIDCEYTQWSAWSCCSEMCGEGTQTRERDVSVFAANGGTACGGDESDYIEEQACNAGPCAVDCVMEEWTEWGACSESVCGGGVQERTRGVLTMNADGGKECSTEVSETQACMTDACPIDCDVSQWTEWGTCDGWHTRTRSINTYADFMGEPCPNTLTETEMCVPET